MKTDEQVPDISWDARPCKECLIYGPNRPDFRGTLGRIFDSLVWSVTGECGFDTAGDTITHFPFTTDINECASIYELTYQSFACLDQQDQESCCGLSGNGC